MPGTRGAAAAIGAAAVLALTAGCGMLGLGEDAAESDEDRLLDMINDSNRLEAELAAAEYRLVEKCLEEQGFTVHDPWALQPYEPDEQDSLTEYYPHEGFLIDAAHAEEFGFGQWANGPASADDPATEDYWAAEEERWAEDEGEWEEPDSTEWDALAPEDQYAWYVAYQGEEYAEWSYGSAQEYADMMSGEGEGEFIEDAEGEEEAAAADDGEIVLDEEMEAEPMPGGCQLSMIEELHGEPELVEETYENEDGSEESYSYWSYGEQNPAWGDETMWEGIEAAYGEQMADEQTELLECISGKGYEGWEFDEYNSLPVYEFFAALYYQDASDEEREMMVGDSDAVIPELPEAAGSSYEEWKAYEIQMAVDFAACGDETGYRDASEQAYEDVHADAYAAVEQDVYAWQEATNDALAKAQELLDA